MLPRRTRKRVAALLLLVVGAAPAWAAVESVFEGGTGGPTHREAVERSRHLLGDVLELYPGATVAVALDDRIVWTAGFGYATVRRQIPVRSNTQFRIDHVAESLTAAAAVRLADEGKLDLDAPIQHYVPSFPEKNFAVTPRFLLAHVGGIPALSLPTARHCAQPEEAVKLFASQQLTRIPGTRFLRSTPGYVLLSAVVAAACRQDFAACVAEKVLKPAGMTSTVPDDPRAPAPRLATPYERGWLGMLSVAPAVDNTCKSGAAGYVSTAEDLAKFGLALMRGEIVKRESLPLLFSPYRTSRGESTGHGFGWQVGVDGGGRRRLVQEGRTVGGRSVVVLVPESRLAVAMLANVAGEHLNTHALKVAEIFAER